MLSYLPTCFARRGIAKKVAGPSAFWTEGLVGCSINVRGDVTECYLTELCVYILKVFSLNLDPRQTVLYCRLDTVSNQSCLTNRVERNQNEICSIKSTNPLKTRLSCL